MKIIKLICLDCNHYMFSSSIPDKYIDKAIEILKEDIKKSSTPHHNYEIEVINLPYGVNDPVYG